jgi:hypothetical protein
MTGLLVSATSVGAQEGQVGSEAEFMPQSGPYPRYYATSPRDYNLRWGRVTGRMHGSVQAEFNDNINLADGSAAEGDLSFSPLIGIGFLWPITDNNVLEFDITAGYRFYLDHSELNTFSVSPDSRLTYQIRVLKAQITLHDRFSVQVDPLSRPELSGGGSVFNYQRLNNNAGLTASWQAIRDITFVGGYSFVIDRTISGDFRELDRNDHVFTLGAYRPAGSRLSLGVQSSYVITEYLLPIQNDGTIFSVGPHATLRVTDFLTGDAGVSYTIAEFDPTGTLLDRDDFEGFTYYGGLRHRMNSRVTHSLRVSKAILPGLGSNFTDILAVQYGAQIRLAAALTLNSSLTFEDFSSSGIFGEDSQRYLWYLGSNIRLSSRWHLGASYAIALKDSAAPGRDYMQNRVTLQLTRRF